MKRTTYRTAPYKQYILLLLLFFITPTSAQVEVPPVAERIYNSKDNAIKPPSYPNGERAMYAYLAQNVRYPRKAVRHRTQGKVVVTAIVEKDGQLSNIKITDDIGDGCGKAVIRSVKRMQRWNCATMDRVPVRYQVRIPVTFRL